NLLLASLCITFYWGLAKLLKQNRLNLWLLLSLLPILFSQVYFLYLDPQIAAPAIVLHLVLALQSGCIVALLLGPGLALTRMPRLALVLLFLYWARLQIFIAGAIALPHRRRTLTVNLQVDGRFLLLPLLPVILICLG